MEKYEKVKMIGRGSYSQVYLACAHGTGNMVAVKELLIDKDEGVSGSIIREVCLLKRLHHNNIVRLLDVVHHDYKLNLIFEYFPYDMKKLLNNQYEKFNPATIKVYMHKIISAVAYCHSLGVIHRDLKPQNILVDDTDHGLLKVADFGLARFLDTSSSKCTPNVVTLSYRAPEILLGLKQYSFSVDTWSVGCIFGEMVNQGNPLFPGRTDTLSVLSSIFRITGTPTKTSWAEGKQKTCNTKSLTPKDLEEVFPDMEPNGLDLISKMLRLNPRKRITAKKALKHKYFADVELVD